MKRVILLLLCTGALLQADSIKNLADSLIKLRSDVEMLHKSLEDKQEEYKTKMKSLAISRSDLEASIAREDMKIKQLQSSLQKTKERIIEKSKASSGLKPVLVAAIEKLQAYISQGLPFKTQERVDHLEKIKQQINDNLLSPEKALNLVWSEYEDNFRMTHENGLFTQNVMLDGSQRLADVARLGTVMLYFKTSDERMGYATENNGNWEYKEVMDSTGKEQIAILFDSLQKQIRTGYFLLPDALSEKGE